MMEILSFYLLFTSFLSVLLSEIMHCHASSVPAQERVDAPFAMSKILLYHEHEKGELDDQGTILYGPLVLLDWGLCVHILSIQAHIETYSTT